MSRLGLTGTPSRRSGALPSPKPPHKPPKPRKYADAQVVSALVQLLDIFAGEVKDAAADDQSTPKQRRKVEIGLINQAASQITAAIRAAIREAAREEPGRVQAGELDRLMRVVGPLVEQELRHG